MFENKCGNGTTQIPHKSQQLGRCYSNNEGFLTNFFLLYTQMPLEQSAYRSKPIPIKNQFYKKTIMILLYYRLVADDNFKVAS